MKTYSELVREVQDKEDGLRIAQRHLDNLPGVEFIRAVVAKMENDWFMTGEEAAKALGEELNERDWPMLRSHIEEIFIISGFPYTDEDIALANPNCQEAMDEEIRRYAD